MENIILQSLEERRSVRKFKPEQVSEEHLSAILRAGTYAPTGMNRQSPMMIIVQDSETREILRKMNASIMGRPDSDPFYGAPTIVIVLADRNVRTCVEDGSLVMGNLMNAAHAVGQLINIQTVQLGVVILGSVGLTRQESIHFLLK